MLSLAQNQGTGVEITTNTQHTPTVLETSSSQPQKTQHLRDSQKENTELPQASVSMVVPDKAVIGDVGGMFERATTTAASLEAEQVSGNIIKTPTKATSNAEGSDGPEAGDGNPSHMANLGGSNDQTRFGTEFTSYDSPLREGYTSQSDEDRHDTNELMDQHVQKDISKDPPLGPGYIGQSDEDSMELVKALMERCTNLET